MRKLQIKTLMLGLIIGGIVFGSVGVVATNYLLEAKDVEYKNNKNLQDAIDELYGIANSPRGAAMFKIQANGDPISTSNTITVNFTKVEPTTPTITCRAKDASGNIVGTGTVTDNTCNITGLQPETPYTYEIIRTDQNGVTDTLTGTKSTTQIGPTMQTTNLVSTTGTTYQGLLGIVYLDPTDLTKVCDEASYIADLNRYDTTNPIGSKISTGQKTGCMRWYAYKQEGGNYSLLLDHNTTANIAYNSSNSNSSMGTTSGDIGYDLAQLTSTHGWNSTLNPRLISVEEIETVTGATGLNYFNGNGGSNQATGSNVYAWLFDYTYDCTKYGCNIAGADSIHGYWTSTPLSGSPSWEWYIICYGRLDRSAANYTRYGLRPVITVSASTLNIL